MGAQGQLKRWMRVSTVALSWVLSAVAGAGALTAQELLLATTTSVRDSGLLDELLPDFQAETGIRVLVVAVGSGAALRMGAEGNVDALLTHAPEGERELLEAGQAVSRTPFMQNHFLIAGPIDDPVDVASAKSAVGAIGRLAAAEASWVSRDDDSGTHRRENALLSAAGLDPEEGWPGFIRTGSGMGLSLQVAGERRAYILADLGTFLALGHRAGLVALFSSNDESLRNVYSYLRIDPERFSRVHGVEAKTLEEYLLRPATLARITSFGRERFGRALFGAIELAHEVP